MKEFDSATELIFHMDPNSDSISIFMEIFSARNLNDWTYSPSVRPTLPEIVNVTAGN